MTEINKKTTEQNGLNRPWHPAQKTVYRFKTRTLETALRQVPPSNAVLSKMTGTTTSQFQEMSFPVITCGQKCHWL